MAGEIFHFHLTLTFFNHLNPSKDKSFKTLYVKAL